MNVDITERLIAKREERHEIYRCPLEAVLLRCLEKEEINRTDTWTLAHRHGDGQFTVEWNSNAFSDRDGREREIEGT